jgi:hypothetical protein
MDATNVKASQKSQPGDISAEKSVPPIFLHKSMDAHA